MKTFSRQTTLNLESAIQLLKNNLATLEKFKLKSLAIFGSIARNEATEMSDLDILIEFEGAATFDRYMDLKFLLEDLFDTSVDLVIKHSLKPAIRQTVLDEAVYVEIH